MILAAGRERTWTSRDVNRPRPRPRHALTRILELAADGATTAVCAPGAVIRHLLAALAEDAGLDVREYPAVKGSVWALFFSGGQRASADCYPALTSPLP